MWWLYLFIILAMVSLHLELGVAHQVSGATSFLLPKTYKLKGDDSQSFVIRQVPGDGSCLFHSMAAWISYLSDHSHSEFDYKLRYLSTKLRMLAVDTLKKNCTLVLENGEVVDSASLLKLVGEHYNITPLEYCRQMMDAKTWGGGPEIVALSNHFRCPIHVYQLGSVGMFSRRRWVLELCAKFGSPAFDHIRPPLHLLCADGRFPNIKPGQQKETGDHFLAVFPEQDMRGSFRLHGCPDFGDDPVFFERSGPEEIIRRVGGWLKGLKGLALPLFGIHDHDYNNNNKDQSQQGKGWLSASLKSGSPREAWPIAHSRSQQIIPPAAEGERSSNNEQGSLRGGGSKKKRGRRKTVIPSPAAAAAAAAAAAPLSSSMPCPFSFSRHEEEHRASIEVGGGGGGWGEAAVLSHLLFRQRQLSPSGSNRE